MYAKGETITQIFEQFAPKHLAEPGDPIGLQLGSLRGEISKVLVTLDVNDEVVDEAIQIGANLIIAHHAIMYRPISHLRTDTPTGRLYEKLLRHEIAVYVAHTNLDIAPGGMNDLMADALHLTKRSILAETSVQQLYKLIVYVPHSHADQVRNALFHAGAGAIGDYSHCSFNLDGEGTFLPEEGADPYSGIRGELSRVQEVRIETVVTDRNRNKVLQAMFNAHPYEEVAYDLFRLEQPGKKHGLGQIGLLPEPCTLAQFAEQVKKAFDVPYVRVVGDSNRQVQKVAVVGGAGRSFVSKAKFAGADVFVTGDIDYHTAQDALLDGLCMVDPGHNAEKIFKEFIANYLNEQLSRRKSSTKAIVSQVNTEVFHFM